MTMEQHVPTLAPSGPASLENHPLVSTHHARSQTALDQIVPNQGQRSIIKAQVSCIALIFAALTLVGAYVLVPLAMAVHNAVNVIVLAWGLAAAVVIELFLLIAFIILKTEGQERGHASSKRLP